MHVAPRQYFFEIVIYSNSEVNASELSGKNRKDFLVIDRV